MSSLIVPVVKVDNFKIHPTADNLDIIVIGGWQVIVKRDQFALGDVGVYFPPDCVLEQFLSDKLGVTPYLHKQRVKSIRLRQEVSHGFLAHMDELKDILKKYKVGDNVAEKLNVKKYEPPIEMKSLIRGGMSHGLPEIAGFAKYTDIENYRNFTDIFRDIDTVYVSEKIHGSNCRVGLVKGVWEVGSHNRRIDIDPSVIKYFFKYVKQWIKWCIEAKSIVTFKFQLERVKTVYNLPLKDIRVTKMLEKIRDDYTADSVVLYSEIYGDIQDLKYGRNQGEYDYVVYDISVNGEYLPFITLITYCMEHSVPRVPLIIQDIWKNVKCKLNKYATGNTAVKDRNGNTFIQIKEGIVIKTVLEERDPKIGRKVLKYISDDYLTRKKGSELH